MVGSLVIVFPTPHSGGELVLRHGEKEWTFDGASLISSQSSSSIAYIAFYSDVEHEVLKVTSGYRITITYNLYQLPSSIDVREPSSSIVQNIAGLTNFKGTLETMLRDKTFLPNGGILGFGLWYQYPVTYETKMKDLKDRLKGSDALIWNTCSDLCLEPALWVTYGTRELGAEDAHHRAITKKYYKLETWHCYDRGGFLADVMEDSCGYGVNVVSGVNGQDRRVNDYCYLNDDKAMEVVWITRLAPASTLERPAMAYGNEAELEIVYCDPCLLAKVKPASERECDADVARRFVNTTSRDYYIVPKNMAHMWLVRRSWFENDINRLNMCMGHMQGQYTPEVSLDMRRKGKSALRWPTSSIPR